ncbi:MAG: hypothetical protein Ta2E_08160 [Mycoplasmoidaceae bacterium]|nr:MAG: hypothetical protein Ta2E_08160 [Mycoplasmoidaceae bacterium]
MQYPVIISRELIAIPGSDNKTTAGRRKTVAVVKHYNDDHKNNKKFILLTQDNPDVEDPKFKDVYSTCTLCEITSAKAGVAKKDIYDIKFKCIKRMLLIKLDPGSDSSYYTAEVETLKDLNTTSSESPTKLNDLYAAFKNFAMKSKTEDSKWQEMMSTKSVSAVIDEVINFSTNSDTAKFKSIRKTILEQLDVVKRIDKAIEFLKSKELENTDDEFKKKIDLEINQKVNETLSKQQREFYLREKMKTVKEEIGKINPNESDIGSYKNV